MAAGFSLGPKLGRRYDSVHQNSFARQIIVLPEWKFDEINHWAGTQILESRNCALAQQLHRTFLHQ